MNNSQKQDLLKWSHDFIVSKPIEMNYLDEYETFASSLLKHTRTLLLEYNTTFQWERKGNSRDGALTQKNLKEKIDNLNLLVKVVKIRKDVPFSSQIHTYFHELTHLICNHNNQNMNEGEILTTAQKEYVAETTAQALLHSFVGGMTVEQLESNEKWDATKYIESWVKAGTFSKKKIIEMFKQIEWSYNVISKQIKIQA